ncbi:MAG: hypothetical protein ACFFCW_27525 [Candidatus Hodarchaeota archaeon]
MEYTEEQKQEFKSQFAARRRRQLIATLPFIILIILFATINESTGLVLGSIPISIFLPIFFIAIIGLLVFSIKNWRCPACNKYLGKAFNPSFCSKCGVALR